MTLCCANPFPSPTPACPPVALQENSLPAPPPAARLAAAAGGFKPAAPASRPAPQSRSGTLAPAHDPNRPDALVLFHGDPEGKRVRR